MKELKDIDYWKERFDAYKYVDVTFYCKSKNNKKSLSSFFKKKSFGEKS